MQGMRGNPIPVISAPMTNPTLTANGTELNKFAMEKQRQLREQVYREASPARQPESPTASISTAASSSTNFNDTESSRSRSSTNVRRNRQSETAYTVTDATSPAATSHAATSPGSMSRSFDMSGSSRPMSTITSNGGDDRRSSRHVPTLSSFDSRHSHLSHISSHMSRFSDREEFVFPRPPDEEIEALFENIRRDRGLGDLALSMDQKWNIVHSDEQIRWKEDRQKEEQARKQSESRTPVQLIEQTPEWYLRKFWDATITSKQAGGLLVSLRGKEVG